MKEAVYAYQQTKKGRTPSQIRAGIERGEWQADEDLDPTAKTGVELIQQHGALGSRAGEFPRVGQRPCAGDGLIAEIGALLAIQRVAKRDDEVEPWRVGTHERIPRLAPQVGGIVTERA